MDTLSYDKKKGNMGGIVRNSIVLISLDQIHSETKTQVVYYTATNFTVILETAQHTEVQKTTNQGEIFEHQLSFNIAKNRTEVRDWLTNNCQRYFYVQYIDHNGLAIEMPIMRLSANFSTGDQARNRNEFQFKLRGNTLQPAKTARTLIQNDE